MQTKQAEWAAVASRPSGGSLAARALGSADFCTDYGVKYAYLSGAMYKGVASKELVVAMGRAGLMSYFGAGGLDLSEIDAALRFIQGELHAGQSYGMNLLHHPASSEVEMRTVDLYLRHGVRFVEAAAFMQVTPALVKYRLKGIRRSETGAPVLARRLMAKLSRPEVAVQFLQPPPETLVKRLVQDGQLTQSEGDIGRDVPMADEICVEADSGGHTDQGVAYVLMPAILTLRNEMVEKLTYRRPVRVGAAGGIGTPGAAAAAFLMGAEFIMTGSINQCTIEAGTSDSVKDLLQQMNVQDTAYAPAGDMFEIGAKAQVLKRGVFFPSRANKLYELYMRYNSLDEIDAKTRELIESKYFGRSIDEVWRETRAYYAKSYPEELVKIEVNPKRRMALIFKWYFVHSTRLALSGSTTQQVNYQVHCGPAQGAFNQWVKGTALEDWRNRHVADIGERIMEGAAASLEGFIQRWQANCSKNAPAAVGAEVGLTNC